MGAIHINIKNIQEVTSGILLNNGDINLEYNKICIDSRCAEKGDIFICLKGKNYDGHDYIYDAIQKGVGAIIVEKSIDIITNIAIIYTKNNYDALLKIGLMYRNKFKGKVIAITGSCGKTMTKELISLLLESKYKVKKSSGNHNNHIGIPLTLTELNNDYDIAVLELGMNHKGEIAQLSKTCKPDISIITNIGTAHIGNLGSKRKIYKAKMEIINGMAQGILVLNGDDKYLSKVKAKKVIVNKCFQNGNIKVNLKKTIFWLTYNNKKYKFILNMPGKHLVPNCLLAIKVALLCGIDIEEIQKKISLYKPLNNRLNIFKSGNNTIIDDSYNANYEAIIGLIEILDEIKGNQILILGDVLELGKYSKRIHKKIGIKLKKKNYHKIIFVGQNMYYAYKKCKKGLYFKTVEEVNTYLNNTKIENKIVAIKASRSMNFEKIVKNFQ